MSTKSKKDRILGVITLLLAAWITFLSFQLKATGYQGDPGPRMFPLIGAGVMALCGIVLLIAPGKKPGVFLTKAQWASAGKLFAVYILFALLLWLGGFLIAVPITLMIVTYMLSGLSAKHNSRKKRILIAAIFGIVGGALLYLAYVIGLKAPMPTGILLR